MKKNKILIIIFLRFVLICLLEKFLVKIVGKEMVLCVVEIVNYVCNKVEGCNYIVVIDYEKIVNFCKENNIVVMMIFENCKSGIERCWDVIIKIVEKLDFIVNL